MFLVKKSLKELTNQSCSMWRSQDLDRWSKENISSLLDLVFELKILDFPDLNTHDILLELNAACYTKRFPQNKEVCSEFSCETQVPNASTTSVN